MNCCDYNCNQGRDCPARKCAHCFGIGYDASGYPCNCVPTKVAKVGKRMPGKTPLPASPWRAYLHNLASAMLVTLAVLLVSAIVVGVLA